MFTFAFWRQALERALKSAAQAVLLAWGGGDLVANLFELDASIALGAALGGAVLSVLTSIISLPVGEEGSPSAIE
jgi:membrane associated rhomboid family serine protease